MFEFDVERTLLTEENEYKPNQYVAKAMVVGFIVQTICTSLNEFGIFYVEKNIMRVCYIMSIICTLVPQIIAYNRKMASDRRSKYVMLMCVFIMTFTVNLTLFIFSTPMCMLPMILAIQYNSRKISRIAVIGTAVSIAVTPPLGCVMGLWDVSFFQFLVSNTLGAGVAYNYLEPVSIAESVSNVIFFVSFPWVMIVIMFSRLIMSAARKGEENISNRIKIIKMGSIDALTGLYNQNVYRQFVESDFPEKPVGIIFFDVNGLKSINDEKGHEYGDMLLRRCADSLKALFDERCHGFRIGGDEFLVVVDEGDEGVLERKIDIWKKSIEEVNAENKESFGGIVCSMAVGTAFGMKNNLNEIISEADKNMYGDKEKYHCCR